MTEPEDFRQQYRKAARALIPTFAIDFLVPLPVYYVLLPLTNVIIALAAASAVPAIHTLIVFGRRRQVDWLGIIAVIGFSSGLVGALLGGGAFALKLDGPIITGVLGTVFFISVAIHRPLFLSMLKGLDIGDPEHFDKPAVYRRITLITVAFGIMFWYDALTHFIFALILSTDAYVIVSRVLTLTTFVVLFLIVWLVARRAHAKEHQNNKKDDERDKSD